MLMFPNIWLNGGKIVDETHTHTIFMRKICVSCDKPNARTYDLRVVILRSSKKENK